MVMAVEDIAAQMHSLHDVRDPVDEPTSHAIAQLARLLSDTVGEAAEDALVSEIRQTGVIGPIVRVLSNHRDDTQLLCLGLSILVNLADTGGADVVTMHRGTDLLLELLHSADENVTYYAVAGVQNLTCCADCIHLILDARSDEQLRELVKTSPNEHVRRCAAGALCNIRASPQYAARLAAEARAEERRRAAAPRGTETAASRGHSTRKWSPRSEQSLQNALAARVKADALHFAARWRAAVTIQAASRRRLGVRAAHALRWRERSSDAAFFDGEDTGADVLPDDMEAELASIGARLREAYDASSEVKAAISELAHLLSEVADEHCIALIRSLARLDVVRLLVRLLSMIDLVAHSHLAHIGLSALVNVADIGGALLVKRDGGLDLLLALMRSPTESFVFLATAGVQNVLSTPQMANDADCMQKLVRCGAEATLQQLAGHANPSISRSATGALANLAQSSAHKVLKSALYVTEHYKSQAELEVRAQLRSHSSSGIGSGKSSPRSNTADLRNSFVYELV